MYLSKNKKKIGLINTQISNINSVKNALNKLDNYINSIEIIDNPKQICKVTHLILPGVGSFKKAMQYLDSKNLSSALRDHIALNKPILGICLGMQLFADSSDEVTRSNGLNIINAHVTKLPIDACNVLPHVGWNKVTNSDINLFDNIKQNSYFYFSHNYEVKLNSSIPFATSTIHDYKFVAAWQSNNSYGVQFHPEKSGENGLKLLTNFIKL